MGRRPLVALAVAGVALLAPGCLGSSSSGSSGPAGPAAAAPRYGSVVGVVADVRRGRPSLGGVPLELRPVPATDVPVTGRTTEGVRVVRKLRTDTNGDFHLRLPQGRYVFAAKVPSLTAMVRHRGVVRAGQMTTVWIARYATTLGSPIVI